ncbi:MAG: hypothetical protein GF411_15250 [Candidatus Lokiarchaeota archaeon]|nr:hypothetical protein [Candidatus Lokiarchaeota archaeon]
MGGSIDLGSDSSDNRIGLSKQNSYGFNGTIDEIRIYDRALTEEEVSFLYNNQLSLHSDDTSTSCRETWEAYLEQTDDGGEVGTDTSQDVKIDNTDSNAPTFDYTTAWIPPTGGNGIYDTGFTPYAVCEDSCLNYANVLVYNDTDSALVNVSEYVYGQSNYTWDEYVNTTNWSFGTYRYKMSCSDAG